MIPRSGIIGRSTKTLIRAKFEPTTLELLVQHAYQVSYLVGIFISRQKISESVPLHAQRSPMREPT